MLGDRDREIARLAVPALGALVAEPLYRPTDTAILAHLLALERDWGIVGVRAGLNALMVAPRLATTSARCGRGGWLLVGAPAR